MTGVEWLVEAYGCDPRHLMDLDRLQSLFARMIDELQLLPVQPAAWQQFPGAGGITGVVLLAESHLTCHTFPEHRSCCLNLFCCRERPEWAFAERLAEALGAEHVAVRRLEREYAPQRVPA